ncbi:MAG TPA: dihydrodipicolinate reductase [Syntrophobacteria bacterium]|nr:dihydrodipicolinate reductase [Syntrophobacteria bacterium]
MAKKIRVMQFGVGPIGIKTVQYVADKAGFEIVGAVDADPEKIGQDLGELAGLAKPLGVRVSGNSREVLSELDADVVVLTTTSSLERIQPQVVEIVSRGKNVVSSCEELMYPWLTQPEIAGEIDKAAKKHKVSVLSTGVNPGFLMDFFPLVMTGVCREIRRITVERIQDAQFRRLPFQRKIGAGLSLEEFQEKANQGVLRHVGLVESMHLLASGVGWNLDKTEDILTPVIATQKVTTPEITIQPGRAVGVQQVGCGYMDGDEVITLIFRAALGEPNPRDRIVIEGVPDIELTIKDGIHGDIATCAIMVNAIPAVIKAPPGLRTMADVGLIACVS